MVFIYVCLSNYGLYNGRVSGWDYTESKDT